jgi:hypothetical protein
MREDDDRWTALALDDLGVPEGVFQDYLAHGDSLLLPILIHFTRRTNHLPFPLCDRFPNSTYKTPFPTSSTTFAQWGTESSEKPGPARHISNLCNS